MKPQNFFLINLKPLLHIEFYKHLVQKNLLTANLAKHTNLAKHRWQSFNLALFRDMFSVNQSSYNAVVIMLPLPSTVSHSFLH